MMVRLLAALVLLACCAHASMAQQRLLLMGVGGPPAGAAACSPACLGDAISGATEYWGVRCYNYAYAGNVMDLVDTATGNTTGTRLKCTNGVVSALVSGSACTFVTGNACSSVATTCAISCSVNQLYGQIAGYNLTPQGAISTAPTYTTSGCLGTRACIACSSASNQNLVTFATEPTVAQPFTFVIGFEYTSTSNGGMFGGGANVTFVEPQNTHTQWGAGTNINTTSSINTVYSAQFIFNGSSSAADFNGTKTTGLAAGAGSFGGIGIAVCTDNFSTGNGNFGEAAMYPSAFSSGTQDTANSNLTTFY